MHVLTFVTGEQLKEEYANNVNPLKKLPVINHDGFLLTERCIEKIYA